MNERALSPQVGDIWRRTWPNIVSSVYDYDRGSYRNRLQPVREPESRKIIAIVYARTVADTRVRWADMWGNKGRMLTLTAWRRWVRGKDVSEHGSRTLPGPVVELVVDGATLPPARAAVFDLLRRLAERGHYDQAEEMALIAGRCWDEMIVSQPEAIRERMNLAEQILAGG